MSEVTGADGLTRVKAFEPIPSKLPDGRAARAKQPLTLRKRRTALAARITSVIRQGFRSPCPDNFSIVSAQQDDDPREIERTKWNIDVALKEQLRSLKSLAGPFETFAADDAPDDPKTLFEEWLQEAIACRIPEPHAMTLSTVDADGRPDARVLILKEVDADAGTSQAPSSAPRADRLPASRMRH